MIGQLTGVCLIAAALALLLKECGRGELALLSSLAASVYVLCCLASMSGGIVENVREMADAVGLDSEILKTVLKITGIAYIAQSGADLCRDAGESALAGKVELAGKVIICVSAMPAIRALLSVIGDLL